jgi:hypothetical protein
VHEYVVDGWLGPHDGLLYGVGDVLTLTNRNDAVHYDVQVGEKLKAHLAHKALLGGPYARYTQRKGPNVF